MFSFFLFSETGSTPYGTPRPADRGDGVGVARALALFAVKRDIMNAVTTIYVALGLAFGALLPLLAVWLWG